MKTLKIYILFLLYFLGVAFITSTNASAADKLHDGNAKGVFYFAFIN